MYEDMLNHSFYMWLYDLSKHFPDEFGFLISGF